MIISAAPPKSPSCAAEVAADYFTTETHYLYVARRIASALSERVKFVLVTGDPPPDPHLFSHALFKATNRAHWPVPCTRQMVPMGYAAKEELTAILTELLEAERAGVRVTYESAVMAGDGSLAELMRAIEKDEARWCAMLAGHLRTLGQLPSSKLGVFYEKAMVISNLGERVAFLNLGQGLGRTQNCASCCRGCAITACRPISAQCCGRTRRTSRLPLKCPVQPHSTAL